MAGGGHDHQRGQPVELPTLRSGKERRKFLRPRNVSNEKIAAAAVFRRRRVRRQDVRTNFLHRRTGGNVAKLLRLVADGGGH